MLHTYLHIFYLELNILRNRVNPVCLLDSVAAACVCVPVCCIIVVIDCVEMGGGRSQLGEQRITQTKIKANIPAPNRHFKGEHTGSSVVVGGAGILSIFPESDDTSWSF